MSLPPDDKSISRREFVPTAALGIFGLSALTLTPFQRALAAALESSRGTGAFAVTKIRRIENRTSHPVHIEVPDGLFGKKVFDIPPERVQMVDFGVPWATDANAFRDHHVRVDIAGEPRWWIWQANTAGKDLIRAHPAAQWSATGKPVPGYAGVALSLGEAIGTIVERGELAAVGQLAIPDRAIIVLQTHVEVIPIVAKPPVSNNVTTIRRVRNERTSGGIRLLNRQNPGTDSAVVPPRGGTADVSMHVPFAAQRGEFDNGQRLEVVDEGGRTLFWIWQSGESDGDFIRAVSTSGWQPNAPPVGGVATTGVSLADLAPSAEREVVVTDTGVELYASPGLLDSALGVVRAVVNPYTIRGQGEQERPMPATPKRHAVAFSLGAVPSDAYRPNASRNARYQYDDSGKRYDFRIQDDGRLLATGENGPIAILGAKSYQQKRTGENIPIPAFDLVAANSGRVFAKEKGANRFFLMTLDESFVFGSRDEGRNAVDATVPSMYFKLDPEFGLQTAKPGDLFSAFENVRTDHPSSERLPFFRRVLNKGITDMMIVRKDPRYWYLIDARPPRNVIGAALSDLELTATMAMARARLAPAFLAASASGAAIPPILFAGQLAQLPAMEAGLREKLRRCTEIASRLPDGIPTWTPVAYERDGQTLSPPAIDFEHVLDIGVGHVHYHQQNEGITGGEIQPVKNPVNHALYRFFNGPIRDGDGFIDGTCNLYALVRLKEGGSQRYALIYMDEQSYFTQRWRMVDIDDYRGMNFAIVTALPKRPSAANACDSALALPPDTSYGFDPDKFWDPFRANRIDDRSRMAVAAQVLLVTGFDPSGEGRIFSINFSFSSIDHSWRWRKLPKGAQEVYVDEQTTSLDGELSGPDEAVWPQTIRLREDMTIVLKGRHGGVAGRWYQRYLPSSLDEATPPRALVRDQPPSVDYRHEWRFLPEPAFQLADRFSHLGVFDRVNTRSQYYVLRPATAADEAVLAEVTGRIDHRTPMHATEPWIDAERRLFVSQWKFRWTSPDAPGADPSDVPSIFNPDSMFRVTRVGSQWIATWWDKRDDDLMPFDNVGATVTLANGAKRATVVVQQHKLVDTPPSLLSAGLRWTNDAERPVAIMLNTRTPAAIARVRIAALTPAVLFLADEAVTGKLTDLDGGNFEYAWRPTPDKEAVLRRLWPEGKDPDPMVSLWVEDAVGHVVAPERIAAPATLRVVVEPTLIRYGVPTAVTVRAYDQRTGEEVRDGSVVVDGTRAGAVGQPFTRTFTLRRGKREFDPETRRWIQTGTEPTPPSAIVTSTNYLSAPVPLAFTAERAQMRVRVEPATAIRAGVPTTVTIVAEDVATGARVTGAKVTGGPTGAKVNEPFTVTLTAAPPAASVTAPGYTATPVTWPSVFTPAMRVALQPASLVTGQTVELMVIAVDAATGAQITNAVVEVTSYARVGAACQATTTQFPAGQRRSVTLGGCRQGTIGRAPTIVVSAPGYPSVTPVQLEAPASEIERPKADARRRPTGTRVP